MIKLAVANPRWGGGGGGGRERERSNGLIKSNLLISL